MPDDLATSTPRIWTNPGTAKDRPNLVRLTPYDLTLAAVPGADLEHMVADLEDGGDVAGQVIPLSSLVGAGGDEDSAQLTVTFRTGLSKQESRAITFVEKAERDEFVTALVDALGPGWWRRRTPMSRCTAGFWTLGPTAVVALITWGLHAEAALIAQGNPPVNWGKNGKLKLLASIAHWVEQQLGPTGVLIAGGTLVVVGLLLFALVLAEPPMNIVVEPAGQS
jgi:hypothetical protein